MEESSVNHLNVVPKMAACSAQLTPDLATTSFREADKNVRIIHLRDMGKNPDEARLPVY